MMRFNLTTVFTVLGKEITDLRRDPRTLLVSVLLPLILFPLVFTITGDIGIPETAFNAGTVKQSGGTAQGQSAIIHGAALYYYGIQLRLPPALCRGFKRGRKRTTEPGGTALYLRPGMGNYAGEADCLFNSRL